MTWMRIEKREREEEGHKFPYQEVLEKTRTKTPTLIYQKTGFLDSFP
jgi:hypothetical protein